MSFSDFLAEHRLSIVGHFLLHKRGIEVTGLAPPFPPSSLTAEELESLIHNLERAMPSDSLIADLRDWDVKLYDLLADDWFFGATFGPESQVESYARDLAQVFLEQTEKLALDYDQQSDPESFSALVEDEAVKFVKDWRARIYERYACQQQGAA